jgi:hypothetical protein
VTSVERAHDDHVAGILDFGLRSSILSWWGREPPDSWTPAYRPLHRWIDLGASTGIGGGLANNTAFGRLWVSGWSDIRLTGDPDSFPALHIELRASDISAYDNTAVLFVGVSWVIHDDRPFPDLL